MRFATPILAATALAAFVGCSASTELEPFGGTSKAQAAQMAAYAATAKYPPAATPADLHVAVLMKGDTIRLINFTGQAIRDANVWVNGTFVRKVDVIEPQGSIALPKNTFYDQSGHSLADISTANYRVTIQQGDSLSTTLGPVAE